MFEFITVNDAQIHRGIIFFLICIVGGGVQTGSTRHVGHLLAYCNCPGWLWGWRIWWNEWQGKPKYLSTTNPTWPDPGLNPGRRGGKPATNRFSYGAAHIGISDQSTVMSTLIITIQMTCMVIRNCQQISKLTPICTGKPNLHITISFTYRIYVIHYKCNLQDSSKWPRQNVTILLKK
jgi:hypothetical protein